MATTDSTGIEHVVLLMLENRSFDHILGGLHGKIADLDGVDPAKPGSNTFGGKRYQQAPGAARILKFDPKHERPHVALQLGKKGNVDNAGFVQDAAQAYPHLTRDDWAEVMKYHAADTLPAIHTLAKHFTVCTHWHASVPGPTWPNRLFALSGTSLGRVSMPDGFFNWNLHWYDQTTLFDRLNEKSIDWRVYYGDFPLSFLFVHQLERKNAERHFKLGQFFADCAGENPTLPRFSFIEPAYHEPNANDDHPPHDIYGGQSLIAEVYNALRRSRLWEKTLLVVTYDEHGGLYDHVVPPPTIAPDHRTDEYTFDQLGVRVPTVLVSPRVKKGVLPSLLDHTALLKFLIDEWDLGPLGERAAQYEHTIEAAFQADVRTDTPERLTAAPPGVAIRTRVPPQEKLTGHQSAMVAYSHAIESVAGEEAEVVAHRLEQALSSAQGQSDVAIDRVEKFIERI